ncbi:MAG: hypothetical protein HGA86_05075, partial [Anaerolineaceae bacterium]|nr:hypothetical protein [Anaerolineaceae bacterium]
MIDLLRKRRSIRKFTAASIAPQLIEKLVEAALRAPSSRGINPWEFRVSSRYDYSQPFIYLYSDRPIYRPGQTVYLRGIVRTENNGRYVSPPAAPVNLEVYGPPDYPGAESRLITAKSNPLSPYGTFDLSVALPETALPGGYSVRIKDTGRVLLGFDVQEYRKPEVDLSVKAVKKDLEKGSDLNANVQADFFFGAPAGDLPVSWTLYSRRAYFDLPGYITGTVDNSWFYPYWYYFGDSDGFVTEGSGKTGSDGSFEIDIPTAKVDRLEKRSIEELVLEANILDSNGQQVSSRASVLRHPANFYIGVKPDAWSGTSGKEFGYNIQTVDWNKKPSADHTLTAKFQKVNYKYVVTGGQYGEGSYEPEYTLVSSVDFRTGADGRARLTFTPPSAGLYQLEVTDGKAVTQVQTWVGGEGVAGWPDLPDQHLKLEADASQYLAGQTAHIFVPNPYAGQALALVTIERSEIMQRMVLPISGSNYDLAIPVTDDFAPNVYVSVILLGSNENGAPDFRMGYQTLTVDPGAQKLNVQLVGQPQRTTPGGQVTFTLRVTDAQGLPVTGEFSLAIVDKAVLALADPNSPNIMDAFYGEQPLGVSTALSLGVYANRIQPAPAGRGGGGGDMIMAPPGAREKFADTAFWNGAVTTDQLGLAEVKVTLPDNTTTWVVAVRGLDSRTRVGETTLDVVATKDLLIRPVTPRFAVSGDHIRISALVHNNTSNSLDTKVSLSASNFLLDDVSLVDQEVKIPAGGSQRVDWWGTVQEMETLDLIFSAESGNLKDATKPTVGQIPVVKYTAPMTFATAGVVDQGGE